MASKEEWKAEAQAALAEVTRLSEANAKLQDENDELRGKLSELENAYRAAPKPKLEGEEISEPPTEDEPGTFPGWPT